MLQNAASLRSNDKAKAVAPVTHPAKSNQARLILIATTKESDLRIFPR